MNLGFDLKYGEVIEPVKINWIDWSCVGFGVETCDGIGLNCVV